MKRTFRTVGTTLLTALVAVAVQAAVQPPAEDDSPFGLRSRIVEFVRALAPTPPARIDVPPLQDFAVQTDAQEIRVHLAAAERTRFAGLVPVRVALSSGGRLLREGVVTVAVQAGVQVPVAVRALRPGRAIRKRDLEFETRERSAVPADAVLDPQALVGRRLSRRVDAGEAVRRGWLEAEPRVERGQKVKLRLERGPLRIDGVGRAREDGREGEWIRVLNVASRREVLGRVGADGVVHVEY